MVSNKLDEVFHLTRKKRVERHDSHLPESCEASYTAAVLYTPMESDITTSPRLQDRVRHDLTPGKRTWAVDGTLYSGRE